MRNQAFLFRLDAMKKSSSSPSPSTSQLPRVLLQLNPGLGRQLGKQLEMLDHLREKNLRSSDYQRKRWAHQLEDRRKARRRIYQRQMKMDEETRKVPIHSSTHGLLTNSGMNAAHFTFLAHRK